MATLNIKTGEYHQTYDYLADFGRKTPSTVYNFNLSNITVAKATDELDIVNRSRQISYMYQDDMLAAMAASLDQDDYSTEEQINTDKNDSGIEDFAPFKDFNTLLDAWMTLGALCSEYIELYEDNQDIVAAATADILDAAIIKQKMKDKVVLALNG